MSQPKIAHEFDRHSDRSPSVKQFGCLNYATLPSGGQFCNCHKTDTGAYFECHGRSIS
ncbi:MAG TPA: hypothetical protein V6C84_03330 [Coleofasciculaceae cyanobacterium]